MIGLSARTIQRWQANRVIGEDKPPTATQPVPINKLSDDKRLAVMTVFNGAEFTSLPPSQIVPILANRGEYLASESSFYRILKAENTLYHRVKANPSNSQRRPTS